MARLLSIFVAEHKWNELVLSSGKNKDTRQLPLLLERLQLNGARVTIDAMGCYKAIAQKMIDKGVDYFCALKNSQLSLARDVGWLTSQRRYPAEPRLPSLEFIAMAEAVIINKTTGQTTSARRC